MRFPKLFFRVMILIFTNYKYNLSVHTKTIHASVRGRDAEIDLK